MSSPSSFCAICYENYDNRGNADDNTTTTAQKANVPCCERDESSTTFCLNCIKLICSQNSHGIGKCPRCNGYIELSNDGSSVITSQKPLQCKMCQQNKPPASFHRIGINNTDINVCTVCQMGLSNTLRYECNRCHLIQSIPHPMYRYQPTPRDFGATSWACHRRCGDYTFWRIVEADIVSVPREDAPESWGEYFRERDLQSARDIRMGRINEGGREGGGERNDDVPNSCVLQ